jgi:hypothetical protein
VVTVGEQDRLGRQLGGARGDIDATIERGLIERGPVPHDRLVERFRSAFDEFSGDARAEELGGARSSAVAPAFRSSASSARAARAGVRSVSVECTVRRNYP